MELTKFKAAEVLPHIRHDLREIPDGKSYGNENVDTSLSERNYSLIDRGNSAAEVNKYRKAFEKEVFKYNRKDLVHAVELVIQCPADCPPEQEDAFFKAAFDWYCDSYLPAGKDCVFVAEVHKDEHKYITVTDALGNETQKDISKSHLHIMYTPAVRSDKHDGFEYKLCADDLTKRAVLRDMHPSLQARLDELGIKATVYQKKSGDGKKIGLSVKQLKEITDRTGIVLDKSLTIDQLAEILRVNRDIQIYDKALKERLVEREEQITTLSATISQQDKTITALQSHSKSKDSEIEHLQSEIRTKDAELSHSKSTDLEAEKDKAALQEQLHQREAEQQQLITKANSIIAEKNQEIEAKASENEQLRKQLKDMQLELQKTQERVKELEAKEHDKTPERDNSWGNTSTWGTTQTWGDDTRTFTEDKTW